MTTDSNAGTVVTTYNLPPNITYHKHCINPVENWLIVGTGPTVEEDWAAVQRFPVHFLKASELVLLNRAQLPDGARIAHHHVTYHPEYFHVMYPYALTCGRRHASVAMPYTKDCWLIPDEYHVGGSAFLAAYIARQLGVKRAILIGCPLTGEDHYTQLVEQLTAAPPRVWKFYREIVRSMSGNTRTMFGAPSTLQLSGEGY